MQIKPIRNETDYEQALRRVEALWGAQQGTSHGDELDVLISLIEAYEQKHYPIDYPDPIDAIKFRLEQTGKDFHALIGILGQRTRVYEVIRRDRPLSLNMIRKLNQELDIPAEVLIQPVRKKRSFEKRHRVYRQRSNKNVSVPTLPHISPDIDQLLRIAISFRRQIRFWYAGKKRVSEPHDYGIQNGRVWLFSYQIAGHSTGALPDWRKFDVARISKLEILADSFLGSRTSSGKHQNWDRLIASVRVA